MTVRRRWTTDEDEQLRALWNSAPKRRAISERLGRTADAIKLRGRKLDLPRRDRQPRQLRGEDNRISNEPLDRRRNCLMCGEPFQTTRYQFVCFPCKNGKRWQAAQNSLL